MQAGENLFAPESYREVRRPLLEAQTLPSWCYTSQAFYEREVERIFFREWNFIGRADRIPNHGDYFTIEFAGVPVVVVRGKDGGGARLLERLPPPRRKDHERRGERQAFSLSLP